jgi:hypothetical protein
MTIGINAHYLNLYLFFSKFLMYITVNLISHAVIDHKFLIKMCELYHTADPHDKSNKSGDALVNDKVML